MTSDTLHSRISELDEWIVKGGDALLTFFDSATGAFHRDSNAPATGAPTSTNRAFFALHEFARFLREENDDQQAEFAEKCLRQMSSKYFSLLPKEPEKVRSSSVNGVNTFTDSHLLLSLGILAGSYMNEDADLAAVRTVGVQIATEIADKLGKDAGGKPYDNDRTRVHDFVTLHAVRGLDVAVVALSGPTWTPTASMQQRIKDDVVRFLGYHFSSISSKFDVAALAFSISLLNRFTPPDAAQLTVRAIKSIADVQSDDGSWHTRVLFSNPAKGSPTHLYIASYEIAFALTMLLARELAEGRTALCPDILPTLERTFNLAQANFVDNGAFRGWSNDHTLHMDVLESWATAIVLAFLIHYRDALHSMRRLEILRKYGAIDRRPPGTFMNTWPDLAWALRSHEQLDLSPLRTISDPTKDGLLSEAVERELVHPIAVSAIRRPQKTSLILYGPPGSRKTTLVRRIAAALHWPLIVFFPPHFLPHGLEGFEAAAAEIFADLSQVRRAVVFFDECEAFFKERKEGDQKIDSRTLGAFITAGMLPRLQDLHDDRWVVFVLGTNDEPSKLDRAVTRPGRFDFVQSLAYPTIEAQNRYVQNLIVSDKTARERLLKGLKVFMKAHNGKHAVTFAMLDAAVREIATLGSPEAVSTRLTELARELPPELTN